MARLRVHNFTVSLNGFAAGPRQSAENPLGEGGLRLHEWIFRTSSFRELQGQGGGETGLNDDLFRARTAGVGATVMGRNMFGPVRGPWPDESWRGWWGEDPPFGHDVFVLTTTPAPTCQCATGQPSGSPRGTARGARDRHAAAGGQTSRSAAARPPSGSSCPPG